MLKRILVLELLLVCGRLSAAEPRLSIGTNLNGLSYFSTELPFLDAFKNSGPWVSGTKDTWNDGRKLDLDRHGWVRSLKPGQVALSVLFSEVDKFSGTLARRYVVEYEGTGTLEYAEAAKLVEHSEHRDVIKIETGEGNATMTLTSTDPKDYLRNIRVTPEGSGAKPGEMFNPVFLESLKGYRALRFGIWMLGDGLVEVAGPWGARSRPKDARWWTKGAPVEVMVALANRVHADPWFSIPHAADDDYVRRFAEAVKKSLDPGLKVYLEYSNEVWNVNFPQTAYAREKGLALGLSRDPDEAMYRFYAKRAVEIFSIWEQVLGKERLVRLLSFQFDGVPEYGDELALSFGDTRDHVDALSVGPYFGGELGSDAQAIARVKKMTLDELMRELETVSLPYAKAQMLAHAAVARKHGLPMIAYEGGHHLANYSGTEAPEVEALFNAANRDPRMGAFYTRHLKNWTEAGGGLFMHELDCARCDNGGCWGAVEYLGQPRSQAPKYAALMRFIEGKAKSISSPKTRDVPSDEPPDLPSGTLKDLAAARGLRIGGNYDYVLRSKTHDRIFKQEFNVMTLGTWWTDGSCPSRTEFDFSEMDTKVNWGRAGNMELHGHVLVWFNDIPDWLKAARTSDVEAIMNEHIDTVVGRYAGKIKVWDVVNEAVNDDDGTLDGTLRLKHKWAEAMGVDYIRKAFVRAHAADPTAMLRLNEYDIESSKAKFDGVKALLINLKIQGVPVHALGWQLHVKPSSFDAATLLARMNEIADLGFDNYITELDVELPADASEADYEQQKQTYKTIIKIFLAARRHKTIVFWGLRDGSPYSLTNGHPLLFDKSFKKKPAYFGVQEALSGR